jgi:formylglycine-generating enzyme required for sulfatase activity
MAKSKRILFGVLGAGVLLVIVAALLSTVWKHDPEPAYTNSIGMEFVLIPPITVPPPFVVKTEDVDEKTRSYEVAIEDRFYLGKYEVTQAQWEKVMGNNPSRFKGRDRPVESVSFSEIQAFVKRLNELEGTGKYRLPSVKEWEYAARAGSGTYFLGGGDRSDKFRGSAWYANAALGSDPGTHPVGRKEANPWGLYDMYGNVGEDAGQAVGACETRGGAWATGWITAGFGFACDEKERSDDTGFRLALDKKQD